MQRNLDVHCAKKRRARAGAGGELQRNKAIGIIDRYVIQYLFC